MTRLPLPVLTGPYADFLLRIVGITSCFKISVLKKNWRNVPAALIGSVYGFSGNCRGPKVITAR